MNRTGAHHNPESRIATRQHIDDRRTTVGNDIRGTLGHGNFFVQDGRGNKWPDLGNPEILSTSQHG
jgi:hypothetical protein